MIRSANLAGLITLAVLAALPLSIFSETFPSEASSVADGTRKAIGPQRFDDRAKAIVQTHLDQYLKKIEKQLQGNSSLLVLLHSEKLGLMKTIASIGK